MPGQELWGPNKVSSYLFGTNDSINYGSPNVENESSVQNFVKEGRLTILRTVFNATMSDSDIQTRLATLTATGTNCLVVLDAIDNATFMEHAVQLSSSVCKMYEFGNEPDYNGVDISTYMSDWTTQVPKLRALAPGALFGGPTASGVVSYLEQFLQMSATSVQPDFVSFHDYPCWGLASESDCLTQSVQTYDSDISTVIGWEMMYLGHRVPTGISEYNFDPGSSNLSSWGGDCTFMFQWTELALQRFIADGYDFAMQFTSLNYGGCGFLDMFDDATFAPKGQFWGVVDEGQKNGSGSTLSIPSPVCP